MDDDDDDDASVTDEVQQKLINPYHTGFPDCLHRDGRNATSNLLQQMVDHDHDGSKTFPTAKWNIPLLSTLIDI